ncbi:MAG: efflux RND transporter permease subunit [Elusimicrobiota bacterium]
MKLYELAVRRRVTFIMLFVAILCFGLISLLQLKPDLLPDITFPGLSVMVEYSGAGPLEIETLITRPLEEGVSAVSRVKKVTSSSREGRSVVTVEFSWGTNMDTAVADVRAIIDRVKVALPEDAGAPMIFKFDLSMMPIMFMGLTGPYDLGTLRQISEDQVEARLENIDGVATVFTGGGLSREIRVELDSNKIEGIAVPVGQVISAIAGENLNYPGGKIKRSSMEYTIRNYNEFKTVEDVGNIVVARKNGISLFLKDIAALNDTYVDKTNEIKMNGNPAVMVIVQKRSGANTVETARKVRKELNNIKKDLPRGIDFVVIRDNSEYIEESIKNLSKVALMGGLLAILILLIFLRNIRATIIIALSIPISIIACFVAMRVGGVTLNIMSMGGLALVIGMLVDNSVVVLENIFRHAESGRTMTESSIWGTGEVAMPIMASTLTTIAVFIPIFFVPGIAGVLFKEQAMTVTLSLTVSLFSALTLIPMLSSMFLKAKKKENEISKKKGVGGKFLKAFENSYSGLLEYVLDRRKRSLIVVAGAFIFSLMVIFPLRWVPSELMPKMDQGELSIKIELPVGTKLEKTIEKTNEIEKIIYKEVPEIKNIMASIGPGQWIMSGESGAHTSEITIQLISLDKRKRSQIEITDALREKLRDISGTKIRFGGGGHAMFGSGSPIEVKIIGYDIDPARELSQKIKDAIETVPGVTDAHSDLEDAKSEYRIIVNKKRAGTMGLTSAGISSQVDAYMLGKTASYFRDGGDEYPITVRLKEKDRESIEQIQNLPIAGSTGIVKLKTVADIVNDVGPVSINREGQERIVKVTADYKGKDLGGISRAIEKKIEGITIPYGFMVKLGGETKDQREAFMWLALALLGAVVLVYMVMAAQFESFLDPFVIFLTIPLAIIGVIWMFFFTGTSLSIISIIGVVIMVGIVVNNSIVLVDYTNLLRARGVELREAIITAGRTRMRPIFMTALTTILAMLPMAFAAGDGAEMRYPLARAVIGGLLASTFFTLVVIPLFYSIVETRFKKGVKK